MASFRRPHMACFSSLGRKRHAIPILACSAKMVPGGLSGYSSTVSKIWLLAYAYSTKLAAFMEDFQAIVVLAVTLSTYLQSLKEKGIGE